MREVLLPTSSATRRPSLPMSRPSALIPTLQRLTTIKVVPSIEWEDQKKHKLTTKRPANSDITDKHSRKRNEIMGAKPTFPETKYLKMTLQTL